MHAHHKVERAAANSISTPHIVREADLGDLPAIDRLANRILAEHGLPEDSAVAALDARYFESGTPSAGARFWVAIADGQVIASAAVVPKTGAECTFKTFYVEAAHRGCGIGAHLYAVAEAFAHQAGYQTVHLYVSRRFRRAIRFYELNGYRLVEATTNEWEDNVYRKGLDAI